MIADDKKNWESLAAEYLRRLAAEDMREWARYWKFEDRSAGSDTELQAEAGNTLVKENAIAESSCKSRSNKNALAKKTRRVRFRQMKARRCPRFNYPNPQRRSFRSWGLTVPQTQVRQ